jgi:hypothetical protein
MKWDSSQIRSFILGIVQPLKVGKMVDQNKTQASMDNLFPDGFNDKFRLTSPFGLIAKLPKGVTAFYESLFGSQHEQIITAWLHANRPDPVGVGEVVFYSTDETGNALKVVMTLGNDGKLTVNCPTDFIEMCVNRAITASAGFTVNAPKSVLNSSTVEIGDSGLEKPFNGETVLTKYNAHSHYDSFGLPVSPPIEPLVASSDLSQKVKVAK